MRLIYGSSLSAGFYGECVIYCYFLLQKWRAISSFLRSLIFLLCVLVCVTFLLGRKGLMWQNFETDNMDETVDHQGYKISEEHSPKFTRINKQEIIENNLIELEELRRQHTLVIKKGPPKLKNSDTTIDDNINDNKNLNLKEETNLGEIHGDTGVHTEDKLSGELEQTLLVMVKQIL